MVSGRLVALLRAINVGGTSVIKMTDLRACVETLGVADVTTHIQTGNVVFTTGPSERAALEAALESRLHETFGYRPRVFVLTPAQLRSALAHNPFEPRRHDAEQHCHLMFLDRAPAAANRQALMALQGSEYRLHVHGKVLYLAYSREAAARRRTINFERVLGVTGTARTWKVIEKLVELAG